MNSSILVFRSLHLSCHCAKGCSLPNHVRLKAASGSLMIACRMGGGCLCWTDIYRKKRVNPRTLTLLDRLAIVGSTGRGALEFRPDRSVISDREYVDFEKMALEAEQILDSEEYRGDGIEEFQYRGGSPGGARPKIFARHEGKEWLVKFRAKADSTNIGKEEYRYSLLAKKCGIEMPETRLFEDKYFGVERFDRTSNG